MKKVICLGMFIAYSFILRATGFELAPDSILWKTLVKKEYTIYYTETDNAIAAKLNDNLQSGIYYINHFLAHSFIAPFKFYIFPDRSLLDKQWQNDWGDTSFTSQCWMVASGVAYRLDILSPNVWTKQACEHNANDSSELRQIIWHELVHVFHGQYNPDHNFSYIEKLDWLVEGVATFISGQLDKRRVERVKQMCLDNKTPSSLDEFWKGPDKYGLSGSLVAYLDKRYGRELLFELLKLTKKDDVLKVMGITEPQLLLDWKSSFR